MKHELPKRLLVPAYTVGVIGVLLQIAGATGMFHGACLGGWRRSSFRLTPSSTPESPWRFWRAS